MQDKFLYTTSGLDTLTDGNLENGELGSSRVTRTDYKGYTLYAYNDVNQTSMESQGWGTSLYDRVYIVETGNTYRIGHPIPELDNDSVVMAAKWGGKLIINNATTGYGIYPLSEWAPDGDVYYMANFTESDVNADLNNDWQINTNTTYYLLLSDDNPNGKYQATRGVFDDDKDLTQAWGPQGPMDLYGAEEGTPLCPFCMSFDERDLELGSTWGWPIAVPSITYNETAETATLRTLKPTWEPFDVNENVSIFITARTFSNEPVTGTITVDQLIKIFSFGGEEQPQNSGGGGTSDGSGSGVGDDFEQPTIYQLNTTSTIVNGVGVFEVEGQTLQNLTGSFDTANFVIRLNITDNNGNFEVVERGFMVQNKTAFGKPFMEYGDGGNPGGELPPP
ncbi:MAG: hypothetical protein Q9M13_01375 [Mariprofundales bacterium]|nr:hypothetical protein [Mariprofundales bacterium]